MTSDFACSFDDLLHRVALAIAEVVDFIFVLDRAECEDVCLREIDHVDVVTHASAVWSVIVVPKHEDLFALAECDLKHQGNEV